MWETGMLALALSTEHSQVLLGVGGAQGGGDVFGEVRVSGLVTMVIRTGEKHLSTQMCAHLTHVA